MVGSPAAIGEEEVVGAGAAAAVEAFQGAAAVSVEVGPEGVGDL